MKINKYSYLTLLGHVCTDINQGALPAILPFLVLHNNLSYASAAGLIFASNSVSSVVQPLFGYLGDRVFWPWLMSLGVFLAGAGIATIGFWDGYWAIFFAVVVSGVGIALFHPEGGKIAGLVAGENKGSGISIFAVGGNIGFALGPVIAATALSAWGLKGTAVFLLPTTATAIVILTCLKNLRAFAPQKKERTAAGKTLQKDDWSSFAKLSACITCRSVVSFGMMTFIPLYFINVLMQPEVEASARLTLYSVAGAVATLSGGHLADRFGFNRMIKICFTALPPLLLLFCLSGGARIATLLLIPIALSINGPHGIMIALGQKFLPGRIGTASGISLGLTVSIGGMLAPGLGWIGDHFGLSAAMYTIAGVACLAMLFAYRTPMPREEEPAVLAVSTEPAE